MKWIRDNVAKAVAIAVIVLLIVGVLFLRSCQAERTAKVSEKLATGQAGASLQSGQDAVGTVGNRMDADAATDALTRTNDDAIRNAEGADAPVAAPVRNAGLASLCRRPSARRDPKCVQHPDSR